MWDHWNLGKGEILVIETQEILWVGSQIVFQNLGKRSTTQGKNKYQIFLHIIRGLSVKKPHKL